MFTLNENCASGERVMTSDNRFFFGVGGDGDSKIALFCLVTWWDAIAERSVFTQKLCYCSNAASWCHTCHHAKSLTVLRCNRRVFVTRPSENDHSPSPTLPWDFSPQGWYPQRNRGGASCCWGTTRWSTSHSNCIVLLRYLTFYLWLFISVCNSSVKATGCDLRDFLAFRRKGFFTSELEGQK